MIDAPITSITAGLSALLLLIQVTSIIMIRRSDSIVHGDGGNKTMMKRIRGHGNMVEQAPIFLILLFLAETSAAEPTRLLPFMAALFIIGRISHALYFMDIGVSHRWRLSGMTSTLTAQGVMAFIVLWNGLS